MRLRPFAWLVVLLGLILGSVTVLSLPPRVAAQPIPPSDSVTISSADALLAARNIEKAGEIGGTMFDMAVQGDYTYLMMNGDLVVVDTSDPSNPTPVGRASVYKVSVYTGEGYGLGGNPLSQLVVRGSYAYVVKRGHVGAEGSYPLAEEAGLYIVDVSNPSAPRVAALLETPSFLSRFVLAGDYGYLTTYTEDADLYVVELSQPQTPQLVASYDAPAPVLDIAVQGSYAYLASGEGVQVLDISTPTTPQTLDFYTLPRRNADVPETAYNVFVDGEYAYVRTYSDINGRIAYHTLHILDLSTPTAPQELSSLDWGGAGTAIEGNRLYRVVGDELSIWDISDPAHPVLDGNASQGGYSPLLTVVGEIAYLIPPRAGLQLVNISEPSAPTLLGSYNPPRSAEVVEVIEEYAFVSNGNQFQSVNIAQPLTPTLAGAATVAGHILDSDSQDGYVYIAGGAEGLRVVDIHNPATPHEVSYYHLGATLAYGIEAAGEYLYIATGEEGLRIHSSNPTTLSPITTYRPFGIATMTDVAISGSHAVMVSQYGGLAIADITNPAAPALLGRYDLSNGGFEYVAVGGNYAYVSGTTGLHIFDITDPSAPMLIYSNSTIGGPVTLIGNRAYAYINYGSPLGLVVLDVSHPRWPIELGFYPTDTECTGPTRKLAVVGDNIYLPCGKLLILRYTGNGEPSFPERTYLPFAMNQ